MNEEDKSIFEQLERELAELEADFFGQIDNGIFEGLEVKYFPLTDEYKQDPIIHMTCEVCLCSELIHKSQEKNWKCINKCNIHSDLPK